MVSCSFLGHRKIEVTTNLKERVREVLEELIKDKGVDVFLFGSRSTFIDLCYEIVTELKEKYPFLSRVYVRAEYPYINEDYVKYLKQFYEESYYYDKNFKTGWLSYVKRNEFLINESDFCLFYYDSNYSPKSKTKSGTKLAYNYAEKKKKTIINLF